jgi:iron(III) transport system ATP-binding protein
MVTHDPEEALNMGDRIALMRAGKLVQVDAPEAIYRRPNGLFAARYFCELNEIGGRVQSGVVDTPLGRFAAPDLGDGVEAVVAIRPQGIHIGPAGSGIAGRLQRRQFLGEVALLDITIEGLAAPLQARVRPIPPPSAAGEIGVTIDPSEVLVFAALAA